MRCHRMIRGYKNDKNPNKKVRPIIHWRNPIRGLFYYPKGLRRRRLEPKKQEWKTRPPLNDKAIFKPSSVIKSSTSAIFVPSKIIPKRIDGFRARTTLF